MQDFIRFLDEYMLPLKAAAVIVTFTLLLFSFRQWKYEKILESVRISSLPDEKFSEITTLKFRIMMISFVLLSFFYVYSGLYMLICLIVNLGNIILIKKMTNCCTRLGYNIYVAENLIGGNKEIRRPDLIGLPCFFLEPSFDDYLKSCCFLDNEDRKKIKEKSVKLEKSRNEKSVLH